MTGPTLILDKVAFYIQNNALLAPSSTTLFGGGWHAIAGPNGGGKSTLLKAIAGLLNHQGNITLQWHNDAKTVGYMPQLSPFDASLPITSSDFLRMHSDKQPVWQRYKKNPKIETVIEKVGINSLLNKRIGTLSTGERQRVLLACALLNEPSILLLDEPMAGVDKQGRAHILRLLQSFKETGGTLIMVEHDWQIIQDCCDTLVWVDGEILAHDAPEVILTPLQAPTSLQAVNNTVYRPIKSERHYAG
ncbi:metal ABC transporter ATP-binding protein [Marinomonas algarum]|uniref:Metal ABC transporter ATP-binding protein n=1 Tax=Marinomonas algarum TaxID=2883105 RepID=A0A9X1LEA2_9GAMM|nr:metal ABC transporter ATP-binding protein [Marinomonas algarum]MCB5161081.1 metal ABC transporter ATP-binding protein [Marinomonas algarum]